MNIKSNNTLARHIKWVIGYRIILCLGLLSTAVLITSFYDIYSGFNQVKATLNAESQNLSEFIIAQSLIDNKPGISFKIKDLNSLTHKKKFKWQPISSNIENSPEMKWVIPFSWNYSYPVKDNDGKVYGKIIVSGTYFYDDFILFQLITKFCLLVFFSVLIFVLLYPLSNRIPRDLFITPIMNLLVLLKNRSHILKESKKTTLPSEFLEVQTKIIELMSEITEQTRKAALVQIATQVAHDIRAPLSALDIVVKDIVFLPEEQRILIRTATNRIRDIAYNLLSHYKNDSIQNEENKSDKKPELIAGLVLSVISEKRVRHKGKYINFNMDINQRAYSAFANICASVFKRVISNLLDNAIEAMNDAKEQVINIKITFESKGIILTIQDNGTGISPDLLEAINNRQNCFQKVKGHGLGLSFAIRMVEKEFGGQFKINSLLNEGTKINIILPESPIPKWFASKIVLSPKSTIIILDDDEAIHKVWLNRFKKINSSICILNFYTIGELLKWQENNDLKSTMLLIDYELIGSAKTGLDILEEVNLSSSYLVTNFYDELEVRQRCEKLGIRLIAKCFAPYLEIDMLIENNPDLIFIDDDETLISAWYLRAKSVGKKLAAFSSIEQFKAALIHYHKKDVPIYIDSDLGCGYKGQDFARELYIQGFSNIYLSTGYPQEHFGEMPWIKKIVGKQIPF